MIDIDFYMKVHALKKRLMGGERLNKEEVFAEFESYRDKNPVVYNIETTNACNMTCGMCPRTTMMTRSIETLDDETFEHVASQLAPHSEEKWNRWQEFVEINYGIKRGGMSENHFFLHIIPKVIQLHGYGDPLLDRHLAGRIKLLNDRGITTYFSCNPSNIIVEKNLEMFESGLGYIKYSIETTDDEAHKQIRGKASNFSESFRRIQILLDEKKKKGYHTTIIITMLDLNRENQEEDYRRLAEAFEGLDVYLYLKSQDQQWYQDINVGTKSIHWSEFCPHPWASMTIKSNGEATMCMEDFNNEIILGNVRDESLYDIWNGEKYKTFREDHFKLTPGIKCTEQCDMTMMGEYFR